MAVVLIGLAAAAVACKPAPTTPTPSTTTRPTTTTRPATTTTRPVTTTTTTRPVTTTTVPAGYPTGPNGTVWTSAGLVANPVSPAPYACRQGTGTGSFADGLLWPGDCAAHLDGTAFSVPTPDPCLDTRGNLSLGPSGFGPLVLRVFDDTNGDLLLTVADAWSFANANSAPQGFMQKVMTPINLYVATGGPATLTSGSRGSVTTTRVEALPQVSRTAASYRVDLTCPVRATDGTTSPQTFVAHP